MLIWTPRSCLQADCMPSIVMRNSGLGSIRLHHLMCIYHSFIFAVLSLLFSCGCMYVMLCPLSSVSPRQATRILYHFYAGYRGVSLAVKTPSWASVTTSSPQTGLHHLPSPNLLFITIRCPGIAPSVLPRRTLHSFL